jgi:hypothetical protein
MVIAFWSGCTEYCNECKELTSKQVIYQDASGNNLFFGDSAIFNPDSLYFKTSNTLRTPASQNPQQGSFSFFLSDEDDTYLFFLPNSDIDTLQIEVSPQKSEDCCGNKPVSTKIELNSEEKQNTELITIVKPI